MHVRLTKRVLLGLGALLFSAFGLAILFGIVPLVEAQSPAQAPDLSITKTAVPNPVIAGGILTYTIEVTNQGDGMATGVVVTDNLPPQVSFNSARPAGSCTEAGGTVTCNLGDLSAGASATVQILGNVDPLPSVTEIVNAASVASNEADQNPSDNSTSDTTAVNTILWAHDNNWMWPDGSMGATSRIDPENGATTPQGPAGQGAVMSGFATARVPITGPDGTVYAAGTVFGLFRYLNCPLAPTGGKCDAVVIVSPCADPTLIPITRLQELVGEGRGIAFGPDDVTLYVFQAGKHDSDSPTPESRDGFLSTVDIGTGAVTHLRGPSDQGGPIQIGGETIFSASLEWDPQQSAFLSIAAFITSAGRSAIDTLVRIEPDGSSAEIPANNRHGLGQGLPEGFIAATLARSSQGEWYTVNIPGTQLVQIDVDAGTRLQVLDLIGDISQPSNVGGMAFGPSGGSVISLAKSVDQDEVEPGGTLTYELVVTNNGPQRATSVTVTDDLPLGMVFDSATPSQGSCTETGGVVACNLGNMDVGEVETVEIVGTLLPTVAAGTTLVNQARVVPEVGTACIIGDFAEAQTTVVQLPPDLVLTKSDDPDPATVGNQLTYTLEVTNIGPGDATGVVVTDMLPDGVTFDSATSSQGSCTEAGGTVTCDLGDLANGASATIDIVVTVTADDTQACAPLVNTASVASDDPDSDPGNNTVSEETTIVTADLSVTKIDDPDPVVGGNQLTYALEVTNNGPFGATGVVATDTLPAGVTFASATPSQGNCTEAGGTVTCDLGDLADGASATIDIVVDVPCTAVGTITNVVEVAANEPDCDLGNNSHSEDTTVEECPVPPVGTDKLTTRVYIDQRCDGFFIDGLDVPMAGVPVTLEFPNGATMTRETTTFGWAYFPGFDASGGVTISADMPATYAGYNLGMCPDSSASLDLPAGDFAPGHIAHKHIDFRAAVLR